jgi:flavin reductase (DIM6/NTAB) family NADH-FMN oxidoreductase RutF
MARGTDLVGPFPPDVDPDTYDRRRRRTLWSLPTGLYLLGSRLGDERNLMAINLVTQVSTHPKLVGVAVESDAVTHRLIAGSGHFALSILRRSDRTIVRPFAKPATYDADASTLHGELVRDAAVTGTPVLVAALGYLDCEVRDRLDYDSHTFFVGEVVDADLADAPDGEATEVLRMEDTRMNYGG